MVTHIAGFLGISVLVIVTLGQDTALVIRNTFLAAASSAGPRFVAPPTVSLASCSSPLVCACDRAPLVVRVLGD
ncbi:MAG: hypothetical protein ACR2JC_06555 [Chloroflexota bacterium]